MSPTPVAKSKLLFCEGRDEEEFFGALFKHLGRADVQIVPVGGKYSFAKGVAAVAADAAFPTVTDILIVRDADHASDKAGFAPTWSSVASTLQNNRLPVPTTHGVFVAGPPRVAVFVMPDGATDGMLESLCREAVGSDPATPCVVSYLDCLAKAGVPGTPHPANRQDKAFVRAFLASRPEPDKLLGQAAQAGYWPWADAAFAPLIAVLQQL
jgi:hypothetical protein